MLTSALAAWAAIMAGLVARSGWARAWGVGLMLVLSIALSLWWRPFYDGIGRWELVSPRAAGGGDERRADRAAALAAAWLVRRRAADARHGCDREIAPSEDETPAAAQDTPFFLAFSALGMAAILLPEARAILYYGFMRMDFQHARLSMAMTLPLAALVTILLNRFLPASRPVDAPLA